MSYFTAVLAREGRLWTVHDLDHISQVFAGMAGSRHAAVGAWQTYLGILLRRDDPAAVPG